MANVIYPLYKEALISGGSNVNLSSGTVKIILVDTADYTYSAAHNFLDDVAAAGRVATTAALGTKTVTNGVFDAADTSFATVTGDTSEALVIYVDTGVESTSTLVAYIDTATGLPVTPNGNNINLTFDSGANKIFAL